MTKVLLIDDHDLVRAGIRRLLSDVPGVDVVAEGSSGEEAITLVREYKPDVVFMDIRMPGIGGLEATSRILAQNSDIVVIALSACNDEIYPSKLIRAGARGYITKSADAQEVKEALNKIRAGGKYLSPDVAQQVAMGLLSGVEDESPFAQLSERELQIAQLITSGQRAGEVAELLNISPKTINTHKYRIYEKLKVSNDVELTLAAVKHGLIDPAET